MSVSVTAIIISALVFGMILIFIRYIVHKDNIRHVNRRGQLEMMVGRQVIIESNLFGYQNQNQNQNQNLQASIPPRYELAIAENNNPLQRVNEPILNRENTRPASRPPSYESRVFTLQE